MNAATPSRLTKVLRRVPPAALSGGLRILGLGLRFVLSVFMVRYMTLDEVGLFALAVGMAGLMPSVFGLGLNYFMARQLVGLSHDQALQVAQSRLRCTVLMALVCAVLVLLAHAMGWLALPVLPLLAVTILCLEMVAVDIQVALIARGRPDLANLSLLLRSGLWILPFVALAWALPGLRQIGALAWFWLAGLLLSHLLIALICRHDLRRFAAGLLRPEAGGAYPRRIGWRAGRIWISDLGLGGSLYIDRFLITALAGLSAAGVYFFYASLMSAVYVICVASTVQICQPKLRAAYLAAGVTGLRQDLRLRLRLRKTVLITLAAYLCSLPMIWLVMRITDNAELASWIGLCPILLLGFAMKVVGDLFSSALAAAEQDRRYAALNILNLCLVAGLTLILVPLTGLWGAAVAMVLASAIVLAARAASLARLQDQPDAGSP
ncbi:hypothetical protein HOY34_14215 [Xinfangfangia sp. D13-10-4-6]|uniref:lipopolysaccharide biosynthesis protein n=1 Tax=Pseudogemmobacter hezensis TaxID=2737662 RepID=UPI001551DAFA|nr:hypothetical protein [Pseudogemmobacter hezensis]NPD16350.1 hypothetical protein [Pseudogemmobacter hezensis]